MKCLSCKNGDMMPSETTYFADAEKIDELMDKAELLASELTILEYNKSA